MDYAEQLYIKYYILLIECFILFVFVRILYRFDGFKIASV